MSLSVSDFARELQMVLKTGSVVLGSKKALKLAKNIARGLNYF